MKINLRAYLGHSSWLLFERILRLTMGVAITAMVARALGPVDFGRLTWAQSVVAMFGPFVGLGFDSLVAKWMIREEEQSGRILATALLCKLCAALLVNALLLVAWLANVHDDWTLVAILGFTLTAQIWTLFDQFFQSQLAGRISALVQMLALLIGGAVKLYLLFQGAGVVVLACAMVFEQAFTLVVFGLLFKRRQNRPRLELGGTKLARRLIKESSPLVLASIVGVVFLVIDQLMLRALAGPEALGVFAAAARISTAWYALLVVMASAMYPVILRAEGNLNAVMGMCYEVSVWLSVLVAVAVSLVASFLIRVLYGSEFASADIVLSIHIWTGVFVAFRQFSGRWMLSEDLTWLLLLRSCFGVAINIVMCLVLIPPYGATGAAISTLVAYLGVGLLFDFSSARTRGQGILKIKSVLGLQMCRALKSYRHSR